MFGWFKKYTATLENLPSRKITSGDTYSGIIEFEALKQIESLSCVVQQSFFMPTVSDRQLFFSEEFEGLFPTISVPLGPLQKGTKGLYPFSFQFVDYFTELRYNKTLETIHNDSGYAYDYDEFHQEYRGLKYTVQLLVEGKIIEEKDISVERLFEV